MVTRARTLFILLTAVLLISCHKDLCLDHHHDGMQLQVQFDWAGTAPSAVSGMTLLLYPAEGGAPLRFPFADVYGGTISVTSGSYRAICINDNELLHLQNTESWETVSVTTGETDIISRSAFAMTRASVPRASGTEDERVLREPPLLYADTCSMLTVRATEAEQVIRFTPQMPLGIMHVRIENVQNLIYLQTASGAVSGLSSSLNLSTLKPSEDHCTVPVALRSTTDGALEGYLRFFGHCPADELKHILTVYTMLIDTSKQANNFDVTGQLHPEDPSGEHTDQDKNPDVDVEELDLPKPQPAEGGFDIVVDEWTVNDIGIKM